MCVVLEGACEGGGKPLKIVSTIDSAMIITKTMAKSTVRLSAAVAAFLLVDRPWFPHHSGTAMHHNIWTGIATENAPALRARASTYTEFD